MMHDNRAGGGVSGRWACKVERTRRDSDVIGDVSAEPVARVQPTESWSNRAHDAIERRTTP